VGEGDVVVKIMSVVASGNGDDSVQVTEIVEDEPISVEEVGSLTTANIVLNGNGKGDEIKVNNITIK